MRWVVQRNLGRHYFDEIEQACKNLDYEFVPTDIVPFSKEIPDIDSEKPTIFYGATRWVDNIYFNNRWKPGVYLNPEATATFWLNKYKEKALNYGAKLTTLIEFSCESHPSEQLFFVRPIRDAKEFAGNVLTFSEIQRWSKKLISDVIELGRIPIIVNEPFGLPHEWRLFIVDGKVISGSHYRSNHKLLEDENVPGRVIEFTEEQAKVYSPAPVFVMDICETAGNLYIIEIGCFHSAGFYKSDIEKIVKAVSEYGEKNG